MAWQVMARRGAAGHRLARHGEAWKLDRSDGRIRNLLTDSERAENLEAQRALRDQIRAARINNLGDVRRSALQAALYPTQP